MLFRSCQKRLINQYSGKDTGDSRLSDSPVEVAELVRLTAAETLTLIYKSSVFSILIDALYSVHVPVIKTAIIALGQLGDPRALRHIQKLGFGETLSLYETVENAVSNIKKINPEMMTLLRGSSVSDAHPESLLRPANSRPDSAPEELLRSSQKDK